MSLATDWGVWASEMAYALTRPDPDQRSRHVAVLYVETLMFTLTTNPVVVIVEVPHD